MALPQLETQAGSGRSQIIHAAGIVSSAFVISRVLGVVRDAAINFYFDIDSLEANAYFTASVFPETIFYIIAGGALGSAFIPTFSAYFVRDDASGGWRLFSAVVNLVVLATTVVAGLTAIFAPQLVRLFYPDLIEGQPGLEQVTVDLLRVMLLSPVIFGASGVIMGALNARQHFLLPALAPIAYNLGIILGVVLFAPNVMGLAIGTVGGALGHLAIQLPGLRRKQAQYEPIFTVRHPGVLQVLRLMGPRVLGLSFGQLNHLVTRFLAQSMVLGSIPALGFAWRIMIMPQGIVGQALGIAAFPTFSNLAARSSLAEMRHIVADTLRLIFFLALPSSVLLILLRQPVVTVLFQRGQFDANSTEFVAWALLFYGASLVGLATIEILSRAFYALGDTRTPVVAGAAQLATAAIAGWWLSNSIFPLLGWLQLGGLALAYSLSTILELGLLLVWLRGRMGGIGGRHLIDGFWRMVAASLVMAGVSWLALRQLSDATALGQLILVGFAAGVSYLLACFGFRVSELQQFLNYGRRRLGL